MWYSIPEGIRWVIFAVVCFILIIAGWAVIDKATQILNQCRNLQIKKEKTNMKRCMSVRLQHKKDEQLINYIESLRSDNRRLLREKKRLIEQIDEIAECNNELRGKLNAAEFQLKHSSIFTTPAIK